MLHAVDADKPVSRQHEIAFYNHYGYPNYWEGSKPWGLGTYPLPRVGVSADAALSLPQSVDAVVFAIGSPAPDDAALSATSEQDAASDDHAGHRRAV